MLYIYTKPLCQNKSQTWILKQVNLVIWRKQRQRQNRNILLQVHLQTAWALYRHMALPYSISELLGKCNLYITPLIWHVWLVDWFNCHQTSTSIPSFEALLCLYVEFLTISNMACSNFPIRNRGLGFFLSLQAFPFVVLLVHTWKARGWIWGKCS